MDRVLTSQKIGQTHFVYLGQHFCEVHSICQATAAFRLADEPKGSIQAACRPRNGQRGHRDKIDILPFEIESDEIQGRTQAS